MKLKLSSPILNELRPLLPGYTTIFLFSLFTPFLYFASPIFAQQVMDRVATSRNLTTLFVLAAIAVFLLAMFTVLEWVRQKALARLGVTIDRQLSRVLFDAMHRARSASRLSTSSAALNDFNTVRDVLSGQSVSAVFDACWAPIFIVVMALVHWVFGVLALVLMAFTSGLTILNHHLVKGDSKRHQQMLIKSNEFGLAVSRNVEAVRALGMLPYVKDRWYDYHSKMLGWQSAVTTRTDLVVSAIKFTRMAQLIVIYTIGGLLFLYNEISMSGVFVAMIIMTRGLGPIDHVVSTWKNYSNFFAALDRLDDLVRDTDAKPTKISLPGLSGALLVSRVFAVAPGSDKPILNDVSFTLPQGRVLGVVGASGAGKSCLARVLAGIWPPRVGSVVIGDHDLSHWNEDDLGRYLGYMPQDVELLPGTIAENIARFDPNANFDASALIAAAELAGIQDLIKSLPDGYNTRIGMGGHVLSGGQRSRVALARAVYGNPSFVVLDEPNSNLDAFAEQSLLTMLQKLQAMQTTVVIVTHKLNILSYCDDVLVLSSGTVQAYGARDQIVSRIPRLNAPPTLTVIEGNLEGRRS